LPNVGQEKILVQTMDISKLNIILLLLRGFGLPWSFVLRGAAAQNFGFLMARNVLKQLLVVIFDPLGFLLNLKLFHLHLIILGV
jgi:hypothetical protein